MITDKKYIYQISTKSIIESKSNLSECHEEDNDFSFRLARDCVVVTEIADSLEKTIEMIENSSLIYIMHREDHTSYFELGLAISLGKKVYYVFEEEFGTVDFQQLVPYDNLITISYDDFFPLINEL